MTTHPISQPDTDTLRAALRQSAIALMEAANLFRDLKLIGTARTFDEASLKASRQAGSQ